MPDSPDLSQRLLAQLRFPCGEVPEPGTIKNVAPGIYWLRMPLPFQLNHINLWLIDEKDSWTIVDTGINSEPTRQLWEKIFSEQLDGRRGDLRDLAAVGGLDERVAGGEVAIERGDPDPGMGCDRLQRHAIRGPLTHSGQAQEVLDGSPHPRGRRKS